MTDGKLTLRWPNGARSERWPGEVLIKDNMVELYKEKGNWDQYELLESQLDGALQLGRYLGTRWQS